MSCPQPEHTEMAAQFTGKKPNSSFKMDFRAATLILTSNLDFQGKNFLKFFLKSPKCGPEQAWSGPNAPQRHKIL
jgi:hypothetical protein